MAGFFFAAVFLAAGLDLVTFLAGVLALVLFLAGALVFAFALVAAFLRFAAIGSSNWILHEKHADF